MFRNLTPRDTADESQKLTDEKEGDLRAVRSPVCGRVKGLALGSPVFSLLKAVCLGGPQ